MQTRQDPTILIVFPSSRASRIEKIGGIYRFLSERNLSWNLRFYHDGRGITSEHLRATSREYDGIIITGRLHNTVINAVLKQDKPVVTIAIPSSRRQMIGYVTTDNRAIGSAAAAKFLNFSHYKSFASIPSRGGERWSTDRLAGFAQTLAKHNIVPLAFRRPNERLYAKRLSAFLKRIVKPAALFAVCDTINHDIVKICRDEDFQIPDDISIISVDCDPAFTPPGHPTVTSVQTDFERQGYQAAELMHRILTTRRTRIPRPLIASSGVRQVTAGASTPEPPKSDFIVDRATAYIRKNIQTIRSTNDVAQYLHCSRRLVDLRFRENGGLTLLQSITRARLALTAQKLKTSLDPISDICSKCGWISESRPKVLFKRHYGVSMRDWRKGQQMRPSGTRPPTPTSPSSGATPR